MGKNEGLKKRPDILNALSKIESERVDERHNGLLGLKAIINDNRQSLELADVDDKGYHTILEVVFRVAKVEVSNLARASKYGSSKVATRLSACAGLVRTIVEVACEKLRYRTVKALVEHVCQSLTSADAGYCEPLISDYFKALVRLLEYRAHLEHFQREEWHDFLDFCIKAVQDLNRSSERPSIDSTNGQIYRNTLDSHAIRPSRSATPSTPDEYGVSFGRKSSQSFVFPQLQGSAQEILLCLQHLVSIPCAPLLDKAEVILTTLINLLRSFSNFTKIQQAAFETINPIFARVLVSDMSLAMQTMEDLIPLIRTFWHRSGQSLKESLLSILHHGESLLSCLIANDEKVDCKADLLALCEISRDQYITRRRGDLLQLDDVEFPECGRPSYEDAPLSSRVAKIRLGAHKAEEPWSLLYMSATIILLLEKGAMSKDKIDRLDEHVKPPKRQKLTHPLDEIFSLAKESETEKKLYALQMLLFIFDAHDFDDNTLETHLGFLLSILSDDDGLIASWTMLIMSCAAGQKTASGARFRGIWLQTWRLVARQVTSTSTCRAACRLMAVLLEARLVEYADVADLVDGMVISADLNGPAECDEAATKLWEFLLVLRGQANLVSYSETTGTVLHWLCKRWNPAHVRDRQHAMYIAQHNSTYSVWRLMCICLGIHSSITKHGTTPNLGRLSQTRLEVLRSQNLIEYLLLDAEAPQKEEQNPSSRIKQSKSRLPKSRYQALVNVLLEFLILESSLLLRDLFSDHTKSASNVNADTIRVTSSLCIIGYALLSAPDLPNSQKRELLRDVLDQLRVGLKQCLVVHERRRELVVGILDTFGAFLGQIGGLLPGRDPLTDGAICMSQSFDPDFWLGVHSVHFTPNGASLEPDVIELDFNFESQVERNSRIDSASGTIHYEIAAATGSDAYQACIAAKICFMSAFESTADVTVSRESLASSLLINYLVSLSRRDFVLCRNVVRQLLVSGLPIVDDDADTLLQHIGGEIVGRYELERSEVGIGLCLDTMTDLAEIWTAEGTESASIGEELYKWLMNTIISQTLPSPHVHICAASLFQRVIQKCPEYANPLSFASARTMLFQVLRDGNSVVKYHIGNSISNIFNLFVLKEHDSILEDIIESLPSDPSWKEGIALRLLILANLAASWSTLLRRCVYAIFETPGHVPLATGYAKRCLTHVSYSLGLPQSRDLFKLFVSQIIYTWLETQPLRSIPFSIFGYASLEELLKDVQDEVVGQIMMRGKDNEAAQLADDVHNSLDQILEASFSKAAAYSIARDVAVPPSTNLQASKAEARLRQALGKEKYASLIIVHFAEILALLFTTMDCEEQIEKAFRKRAARSAMNAIYLEIKSYGASDRALPPSQQPSFKSRCLIDEIEYLCRRTSYELESIWSPTLYVYIFRRILSASHPAFGSLHACSVVRKLRILVCMAGDTALKSYALEMALHSLKPFLTDAHCAEDAIGIFQYLVIRGFAYLKEVPSFVAGNAVPILISMKSFFGSTQDSTTQESQFRATMFKAQAFHAWFTTVLSEYKSPLLPEESAKCFRAIVKAASSVQDPGNARIGTYESDLLLGILEDQRSGQDLFDKASSMAIMRLLCTSFQLPSDFRDDILGDDEQAAKYASIVWKTCQRGINDPDYLLWCGHVLGRAYAGKGHLDRELILEARIQPENKQSLATPTNYSSQTKILELLQGLLHSENDNDVGQAETTLRAIVTGAYSSEYFDGCEQALSSSLTNAMLWKEYHLPKTSGTILEGFCDTNLRAFAEPSAGQISKNWIQRLSTALAIAASDDQMLSKLPHILHRMGGLAEEAFPYILHLVLLREVNSNQTAKKILSEACRQWFDFCIKSDLGNRSVTIWLRAILYLRTQSLPHEKVKADRSQWLEIDHRQAAVAAAKCSMYKTALMFLEIDDSEHVRSIATASRRASTKNTKGSTEASTELLLDIYQNIDEQDAFYGVQQPSSLTSMMAQLEYEHAGFKSLSFRGAHYDGQIRHANGESHVDEESMIQGLDNLDLNGLSQSLLNKMTNTTPKSLDAALHTARKLEHWDISAPASHMSSASTVFKVFHGLNSATDSEKLAAALQSGFSDSMEQLLIDKAAKSSMRSILGSLAVLTELEDVFSSQGSAQLEEVYAKFEARNEWMQSESFEHISGILSCRETAVSSLSKKPVLQSILRTPLRDARSLESRILLASSEMSRSHGALQNALTTAMYLNRLVKPCQEAGVDINAAVQFESAHVLWSQGEMTASIRMLQDLQRLPDSDSQLVRVGKPELLAKLGHQISEARLEKPDEIIKTYLGPAIKALHGVSEGDEASEVFHEFAYFCDRQLQNADILEDFQRIQKLRARKEVEVRDLQRMIESAGSQTKERENLKSYLAKAKQWFDLDNREFQRLRESRQTFLRQSLENYLLCLKASDKYDNDSLRFSALWLENHDSEIANAAVSKHINQVGSRKFAPLMNQWSSRLLDVPEQFQTLLSALVVRICADHPYHGMYQIFAGSKTKGGKDETALARNAAANNIVTQLRASKRVNMIWLAVHNTNICFVRFATEKLQDSSIKPGSKVKLSESTFGQRVEQEVLNQRVPPPTMTIPLRADCNYNDTPSIRRFQPEYTVASGISAPKILTAVGTDGNKYKQLFKGGNDDLRQDAIMEQVFAAVSSLLRTQRPTRQRALKIRTYKVLPLTSTAGIIEFVPNTIPLHDYLMPAHQRHFPNDLKPNVCRKNIADSQDKSVDQRIKRFRQVCNQFHPVLRYFFTERFESPDIWFETRLAYTRSTAAISILGHILGLGDRHGHNILLDEGTGEVVHIDLGIAFEQGRVLPVPEVVPFRLTRDLVDGMGITGTEGVFRRCCEFTLGALRNESYSIMTILDVLRYDPLYSWSLSPLRLKKMQDAQAEDPALPAGEGGEGRRRDNEPGEADRALTVVAKKLSKSLSVQATVNELIQGATDERNLAVLFCGWAAYA